MVKLIEGEVVDYETEEQQIEAIKKWWQENKGTVIGGIVLGLGVIFGWRYYGNYQQNQTELASALYDNILIAATSNQDLNEQQMRVNTLTAEYAGTPYASLAALVLAKQQADNGEIVKARQQLEWVVSNSKRPEIQHIARLRLMRILFAAKQYDEALDVANIDYPESFAAMYEELKGDLYSAKGELDQARIAYDKAISVSGPQANQWLKLKRDDLGPGKTSEPSA